MPRGASRKISVWEGLGQDAELHLGKNTRHITLLDSNFCFLGFFFVIDNSWHILPRLCAQPLVSLILIQDSSR